MTERIVHQVLGRDNRLLRRQFHGRGRNDFGIGQHRVDERAAERVLHQQLLQLKIGQRQGQGLLIGGDCALCPDHFDRREGPDFHLLLIVGERLLGESQLLLLNPDVLVGVHQVPVHVFDLVDGGGDLQPESHIGNFTIVLGNLNVAGVRGESEALKQVLRQLKLKAGIRTGFNGVERVFGG